MNEKQTDLPEMKGPGVETIAGIPELEELAERYAEARDARMEASKPEIERKDQLVEALHRFGKEGRLPRCPKTGVLTYNNKQSKIFITLTPKKETLKVRIGDLQKPDEAEVENEE